MIFTSIGAALGASTAVAAGATISAATATGLGVTALAGGAYAMSAMGSNKKTDIPSFQMPNAPEVPKVSDAAAKAKERTRNRMIAASRTESVKTNPLGIKDEAQVVRKTLLGG